MGIMKFVRICQSRRDFLRLLQISALIFSPLKVTLAFSSEKKMGFVYDALFLQHELEKGHPESPDRLRSIIRLMEQSGLLQQLIRIQSKNDILMELALIHTTEHIRALATRYKKSNDVALAVVGGILAATDAVCSGRLKNVFCATRPPGHHARNTAKVEGFCFYNGIAVAARYAQKKYDLKKILIVDWDYHHGNGTEAFFYSDPSVLYFSTHDYYAYPGTGDPANIGVGAGKGLNINVHLDCHAIDADIIAAFKEKLLPAAHRFKPDLILISAGFDSRMNDLLGCFDISDYGYQQITTMVMQLAEQYCDGRIVSVLEGGYNLDGLANAVKVHVETLLS